MILKFAIRNLLKRPFLNLIKITGLSLALSGILLMVLFLKNELTYDRFHKKSDRICRLTTIDKSFIAGKQFARVYNAAFIPAMAGYFPEVENYVRLAPVRGGVMKHGENYVIINQAFECDSTFFDVFDADLISGNHGTILNGPGSMVISESFAKRTFGDADPEGQILTLPSGQYYGKDLNFTVKGVMKDFPRNSHFHPDFIATPVDRSSLEFWAWSYLLLTENSDPEKIVSGFRDFYSLKGGRKTEGINIEADLQKITAIHLYSDKLREIETNSSMTVIYTLALASLILLLIALANYANLNTGMACNSDKYLFISKISGSPGFMNLSYFLTEGLIIIIFSLILSSFILTGADIIIRRYTGLNLFTGNIIMITFVVMIFCALSLLSGILPLLKQGITYLTASPGNRNINYQGRKGMSKSILVLQYAISTALIIAVIVIARQTKYANSLSLGSGNDNIICFENVHTDIQQKFEIFKEELLKYNSVRFVSGMMEQPGGEANDMFRFTMEGYTPDETDKAANLIGVFPCDYSFADIFNLEFLSGNNFSRNNNDNEGSGEYIINETAMHRLNYADPAGIIGKEFRLLSGIENINIPAGRITGVVKDFHLSGIRKKVEPLVLFKRDRLWLLNFVVSFNPGMEKQALNDIRDVWTKLYPGYPFQYKYVRTMYRDIYRSELLQVKLLSAFTFTALFICSMGLLGLALLMTRRRTKEIGLRKINGAGTGEMVSMLNLDLIKWIILSFVFAVPVSIIAMRKWLGNFAYRINLSWWIFVLAGTIAVLIALLTISIQSWKAASQNPVDSLRYE